MIVKIPITPNHEGFSFYVKEIEISDFCPVCGAKRGEVFHNAFSYDGSRRVVCDGWKNPCGHIDKYADCVNEAKKIQEMRCNNQEPLSLRYFI